MADYTNTNNVDIMDWNDTIENDGQEFVTLPEGDYFFTVMTFERGRFPGSAKIPPCNKATLTLQVQAAEVVANIKTDLILFRSLEWKLSSFFRAIGQKKHGEKLVMNWNTVVGSSGRCHVTQRKYNDKNGVERIANDVDRYYDFDPEKMVLVDTGNFAKLPDNEEIPF